MDNKVQDWQKLQQSFCNRRQIKPCPHGKGQCKIYVYAGPEQKGTGHILFLSCTEAGHKEFLCVSGGAQRGTHFFILPYSTFISNP